MVIKCIIGFTFLSIGLLMLYQAVVRIKSLKYDANRFSAKQKGKVIDYRKKRHSLADSKDKRILYHPVIKYKRDGEVYNSVSEIGYNREYYKVGNIITIYCDVMNPNKIKTKGERSTFSGVVASFILSTVSFIGALLVFVL